MGFPLNEGKVGEGTLETKSDDGKHKMALNYMEQVCLSRCTAKWMQGKQVIDKKLKGQIQNPLLFSQNLP